MRAAVERVGHALLIDGTQDELTQAVNMHFTPLTVRPNDGARLAVFQITAALGRIAKRTEMTFNWR